MPHTAPARHVPLAETLHAPGKLLPLSEDRFGNGPRDAQILQVDDQRAAYLGAKAALRASQPARAAWAAEGFDAAPVRDWLLERVQAEHPGLLHTPQIDSLDGVFDRLQEDGVVMRRSARDPEPRAVYLHVSFPSGWAPERMRGASFAELHRGVPDALFAAARRPAFADRLFAETRVRFVWTLTPDPSLDQHPDRARTPWPECDSPFLRVERQVLVPLDARHGLFLIRLHVYPCHGLDPAERAELARRLEAAPADVRAYKGWLGHEARIRRLLNV